MTATCCAPRAPSTTSCSRRSASTAARRCGPRRTCAPAWPPATCPAPRRRWAGRSRPAAWWSRATSAGASLGYPTANVPVRPGAAAPADGVYAGRLTVLDGPDAGATYPAAISVGTNPTFAGERDRRVESYVLDRTDLEFYGHEVEVAFVERLRGMVQFASVEDLLEAMAGDVARARTILAG
ncbi:riboflavin kinase [Nocardioides convexus]|uniref:riboflavin kinase n=1 Tax=Nocardioides convexus TaxID=2712224 RepID=UPI0031013885